MKEFEEELKSLFIKGIGGDERAYAGALTHLARLLRSYMIKALSPKYRSAEQADDLVQEVLISLHRKRSLYDETLPLLPWVYAIAKYRLIDFLRFEARRPDLATQIESVDPVLFSVEPESAPEMDASELLAGLNDRQKEIVKLAKVDELSIQEIASKMAMSTSAVKVTIHRSLKLLRSRK